MPPPEPAVTAFLTAVFDAGTPSAVAPTVCAGWYPEDALSRTLAEVGPGDDLSNPGQRYRRN